MIKRITVFLSLCLIAVLAFPQPASITNILVSQRSDGSGFVDIYFNLSGPGSAYNISLEVSFNAGSSYQTVPANFLSGDMAGITPGSSKHIVWDGLGSFPNTFSTQARLELTASALNCGQAFTDTRDGQTYSTVQIGNQCWMSENLKYLPSVAEDISNSYDLPLYYVNGYNGTDVNAAKNTDNYQNYGVLYNWPAAITACPIGWQLPSNADFNQLIDFLVLQGFPNNDVTNGAGNALKSCRQTNSPHGSDCNTIEHPRWDSADIYQSGFDSYGFSALPGGNKIEVGYGDPPGKKGTWWTSSESSFNSWANAFYHSVTKYVGYVTNSVAYKKYGYSVRCFKTSEPQFYQLNVEINPTGAGTAIGPGQYLAGGPQVNLNAIPNNGWLFVNWTDEHGLINYNTHFNYTMPTKNVELTANFIQDDFINCGENLIDARDGQIYKTVLIGEQCWMSENLNFQTSFSWCYQNEISNCNNYGRIYDWNAAINACPSGWHLPNNTEWTQLIDYLVAQGFSNNDVSNGAGNALRSCRQVNSPLGSDCNTTAHPRWNSHEFLHGFDAFGFSALPGGERFRSGGFANLGNLGSWWSSDEASSVGAWTRYMGFGALLLKGQYRTCGFSARCLRD